ncbi:uncharacterized protein BX664DRAFT_383757 [Halteromyces radiatus]|uniref:uncharacterized protein n=1 Tax=Halteromyces radiatus TaxID=101107 RepID=UPI00221ECA94|nr:uncharacterized protein BX664DRAFT_383757 [Halteromyces radiatus]KAI8097481.1 hypothetical protein BX664DRAFT_383757 [Halteromyces radiatus]
MKNLRSLFILLAIYTYGLATVTAKAKPSSENTDGNSSDGGIVVPRNDKWLAEVDVSNVPKIPIRPVGSGTCENAKCDGTDNDKCFESCGNKALPTDIYGCPNAHEWALTFDDGPSNFTGQLLDSLDALNIKATFCVMGSNVKRYPDMLKRAYEAGHHIASHTYSHPHLMSLTNDEIIYEMKATEEAIRDVIGIRPTYVRPPFGEADDRVKGLMKAMGYKILLWNVDPTDYDVHALPNAADKIQGAFKAAANGIDTGLNSHDEPGYISLQHDLYKSSIDQVPDVIKFLTNKGYSFKTAAECIGDKNPHQPFRSEGRVKAQSDDDNKEEGKLLDISSSSVTDANPPSIENELEKNTSPKNNEIVDSATTNNPTTTSAATSSYHISFSLLFILMLLISSRS